VRCEALKTTFSGALKGKFMKIKVFCVWRRVVGWFWTFRMIVMPSNSRSCCRGLLDPEDDDIFIFWELPNVTASQYLYLQQNRYQELRSGRKINERARFTSNMRPDHRCFDILLIESWLIKDALHRRCCNIELQNDEMQRTVKDVKSFSYFCGLRRGKCVWGLGYKTWRKENTSKT
jgi:hypothetical protein